MTPTLRLRYATMPLAIVSFLHAMISHYARLSAAISGYCYKSIRAIIDDITSLFADTLPPFLIYVSDYMSRFQDKALSVRRHARLLYR